jgi:hypothetical protein
MGQRSASDLYVLERKRLLLNAMKPFQAFLISFCALASAGTSFAEEIVVRAINVTTGAGMKNCYVNLMGGPNSVPAQQRWLTVKYLTTAADGSARFNITQPPPNFLEAVVDSYECLPCDRPSVFPFGEVLRIGALNGMNGTNHKGEPYCRPNHKKLEEITAKRGEIVIFVRKTSFIEKWSMRE